MKTATAWWGVQFLAENQEDEDLLKKLKSRIGDKADVIYDDGDIFFTTKTDDIAFGFSDNEIKNSKLVLQIER